MKANLTKTPENDLNICIEYGVEKQIALTFIHNEKRFDGIETFTMTCTLEFLTDIVNLINREGN